MRIAAVAGACVGVSLVTLGIFYHFGAAYYIKGIDFHLLGHCIYEADVCSAAAGTWALGFGTFGAFTATTLAAVYAARIYDLEVQPRLGQSHCVLPEHADINERIFILLPNRDVTEIMPVNFDEANYSRIKYEFANLGRQSLVNVTIEGTAEFAQSPQPFPMKISLGNIAVDKVVHLTTYFPNTFGLTTVTWAAKSACANRKKVNFHPSPAARGTITFELPIAEGDIAEEVIELTDREMAFLKLLREKDER